MQRLEELIKAHEVENMKRYKATEAKLDTLDLKQELLATRLTHMEKKIKEKLSPTVCGRGRRSMTATGTSFMTTSKNSAKR